MGIALLRHGVSGAANKEAPVPIDARAATSPYNGRECRLACRVVFPEQAMDHHQQHHEHHRKEREEKKKHEHEHENQTEKVSSGIHPAWFLALGVVLTLAVVLLWIML
jgi:hypothetical protein